MTVADNHPALSVVVAVLRRDFEVGGTLLAGALGFRLFAWRLPGSLRAAAALGFTEATSKSREELVNDHGMSPLTASMMGELGQQAERGRYLTALIGLLLLLWAGLTLAR